METPEIVPGTVPPVPRRTLAVRIAERSRLRAERLARLAAAPHAGEAEAAPAGAGVPADVPADVPATSPDPDAAAALEEFLRSLTRGLGALPAAPGAAAPAGEVLPFQRPAPPEAGPAGFPAGSPAGIGPDCDLGRLAGVGPGLAWALRRAGIPDLAGVAALEPEALAARLGPLGRLVPARAWVEAARGMPGLH
jgi:predicted flap endonuclease-1-like 5' DNA nuclease